MPVATPDALPTSSPALLLTAPLPLQRIELPAEALALWRPYAAQRPTLLVVSDNPMLVPVPAQLQGQVRNLVATAVREELARRGSLQAADPLLLPTMTVDAALRSGWFGRIVWALPLRTATEEPTVDAFRKVLSDDGMLDAQELAALRVENQLLCGTVRGTPLLAGHLDRLPPLEGPLVVHIDPSYFQARYRNEVATPLLSIVYELLYQLRERHLSVLAVTYNYGNLEGRIALDARFLGEILTCFVEHPERSKEPPPRNWQRQADIFHLESLFENDRIRATALAMERDAPDSAWVKFTLYRAAALKKAGDVALKYLAEAVARDRIYATEYLPLAQMAYDKGRPDAALQMLRLAAAAFPENVQIRLKVAQLVGERGDRQAALREVEALRNLPWSTVYYPEMTVYLQGLGDYLQQLSAARPPSVPTGTNVAMPASAGFFGDRSSGRPGMSRQGR